jgi:hypothetical protein
MPKPSNDLVSTKITRETKNQLEFIKSQYRLATPAQGKGDYAALAHLVELEYERCRVAFATQA